MKTNRDYTGLMRTIVKNISIEFWEHHENKSIFYNLTVGTFYYFKCIFLMKLVNYLIDNYSE